MKLSPLRLNVAAVFAATPYALMGVWLSVNDTIYSLLGYLLAVGATVLVFASIGRTAKSFYFLHFPLFLLTLVSLAYARTIGQLPGFTIACVLLTSSWEEVRGFFGTWAEQRWLLVAIAAAGTYLAFGLALPANARILMGGKVFRWTAIGVAGVIVASATRNADKFFEGIAASPLVGAVVFINGPLSDANVTIHGPLLRKRSYGASRTGGVEIHVLIVGESSRRNSWSVYGYSRRTTPYLESVKNEIVFLEHAVSDANITVYAVPMLLTGTNPTIFEFSALHGNIVDLAKEAGYYSSWIVNQDASISYLVGMEPDYSYYSQTLPKPGYAKYQPDELLLPEFSRQLARRGTSLFIGLHVYGSHSPYADRYPKSFAQFSRETQTRTLSGKMHESDSQIVDSYDDSILYMDWFLGQLLERMRALDVPATLTYVSDHGEDLSALDGTSGHGQGTYSPGAFDIPAFVWSNAQFRQAHPDKLPNLSANASKLIRSHDFFYMLTDLMGIQWQGLSPQRSPLSPRFVPDARDAYFAGGRLVSPIGSVTATAKR